VTSVFWSRPLCCADQRTSVNVFSGHGTFGARLDCSDEISGRGSEIANEVS
jgi:hypothetical protein